MNKMRLAAACAFALSMTSASAVVIDDFETGSFAGAQPIAGQDLGASTGGFGRTLDATGTGNLTVEINQGASVGQYSHSQDAGIFGESMITYDLGGADLTTDANAFRLELVNIDLNGVISIDVDGVSFDLGSNTILIDNGLVLPSFADFLFSDFAGADFSNVSSVKLTVDGRGQAALDATLDNFSTVCSSLGGSGGSGTDAAGNIDTALCGSSTPVPEPSLPALIGLGLLGLALRHRRS